LLKYYFGLLKTYYPNMLKLNGGESTKHPLRVDSFSSHSFSLFNTRTHARTHTHARARARVYREFNHVNSPVRLYDD
jgi:hypothetical protein